jgi:hypothetical protein
MTTRRLRDQAARSSSFCDICGCGVMCFAERIPHSCAALYSDAPMRLQRVGIVGDFRSAAPSYRSQKIACGEVSSPDNQRDKASFYPEPIGRLFLWINTPLLHGQRCPRQKRSHRKAQPPVTIAQLISPPLGETHQAAVRLPPPDPSDRQRMVGPRTRTWPCCPTPVRSPTSLTSASRASVPLASGQGCPGLQVPSSSRAAMPDNLMRGPSAHQTGPSPSQTCVGVQLNVSPAGTTVTAERIRKSTALD